MTDEYFELRNKKIVELVEGKKMNISRYIKYINIEIYNRWGLLIHVTKGYIPNWDGITMNGKICSDGVYYWVFNYGDISGGDYKTNGYVQLIR
mgnify:CR=1 FL=1